MFPAIPARASAPRASPSWTCLPRRRSRCGFPNRRVTVSFNGEIYNHAALRRELIRAGRDFRTDHSDTETLLQAYLHWGMPDMLPRLLGMFAFAVLDEAAGALFLARDRVGVKPLYYAPLEDGVVFASETKALLQHPKVEARLDKDNLFHFLGFRSLPAPRTLFRSVKKLGAAEWASVDLASGRFQAESWWNPLREYSPQPRFGDACDELDALLESAVEHRLAADVPVGLLLSGGLDSGVVLQMASEGGSGIHTFTAGYPGHPDLDESDAARAAAERFGSRHHDVSIRDATFSEHLMDVARSQEEPSVASVSVPVYLLARRARAASVPVVLAGEGADELFIGYDSWRRLLDVQRWNRRLPDLPGRPIRRLAAAAAGAVTTGAARFPDALWRAGAGTAPVLGGRDGLFGAGPARHPRPRDGRAGRRLVRRRHSPALGALSRRTARERRHRLDDVSRPAVPAAGAHAPEARQTLHGAFGGGAGSLSATTGSSNSSSPCRRRSGPADAGSARGCSGRSRCAGCPGRSRSGPNTGSGLRSFPGRPVRWASVTCRPWCVSANVPDCSTRPRSNACWRGPATGSTSVS